MGDRPAPAGASLIESLVALALLTMLILGVLATTSVAARGLGAARGELLALAALESLAAELESRGHRGLGPPRIADCRPPAGCRLDTRHAPQWQAWQRRWSSRLPGVHATIRLVAEGAAPTRFELTLRWQPGARPRTITLRGVRT